MSIEGIHSFFEHDLHRLETLLDGFEKLRDRNLVAARECFRQFAQGLRRRIDWEEELVFPVYERGHGPDAATALMHSEHDALGRELDWIEEHLTTDVIDTDEAEAHLRAALAAHEDEERRMLYPTVDSAATPQDVEHLRGAITSFERERNRRAYLL